MEHRAQLKINRHYIWPFLIIIVQAIVVGFGIPLLRNSHLIIAGAILLLTLIMVPIILSKQNWFEPIFFIQLPYLGYVFSSIYAALFRDGQVLNYYNGTFYDTSSLMIIALLYTILGLLSCYFGYYFIGKTRWVDNKIRSRYLNIDNHAVLVKQHNRLMILTVICTIIGLISYAFFIESVGGLANYWQNINRRITVGNSRYVLNLIQLLPICSWLLLAYAWRLKRFQLISIFYFLFVNLIQLSLGARLPLVFNIISAIVIWWFTQRKAKVPYIRFIIVALIAIFVLVGMRSYRFISPSQTQSLDSVYSELSSSYSVENIIDQTLGTRDFTDINILAHILGETPQLIPYQFGKSFIMLPAYAIPRAIWPEKPDRLDVMITKRLFRIDTSSGILPGIISELYLNFGVIGIVFGMFVLGCLAYLLKRFLLEVLTTQDIFGLILYAIICSYFFMHITRTTFDRAATAILINVTIWFAIKTYVIGFRRKIEP